MPRGGFYHDAIERQEPYDPRHLDPEEWVRDMYHVYTDEELRLLENALTTSTPTPRAPSSATWARAAFGDIALVPGTHIPKPKGIRAVADWYMATALYPNYIHGIFQRQCDIAIQNLALYKQAVGDRIVAIFVSGTDFGSQRSAFISPTPIARCSSPITCALQLDSRPHQLEDLFPLLRRHGRPL